MVKEKRRRFHEALLNIFYPNSQQSPCRQDVEEVEPAAQEEGSNMVRITDVFDDSEGDKSPGDTDECEPQKLSRAQRKKLRRKMLKKTASCRRKIIGPLLPSMDGGDALTLRANEPLKPNFEVLSTDDVQGLDGEIDKPGEMRVCTTQNKLKHRRLAKRLSRNTVDCAHGHPSCSINEGVYHETLNKGETRN